MAGDGVGGGGYSSMFHLKLHITLTVLLLG